jgi:hypothetical protein
MLLKFRRDFNEKTSCTSYLYELLSYSVTYLSSCLVCFLSNHNRVYSAKEMYVRHCSVALQTF